MNKAFFSKEIYDYNTIKFAASQFEQICSIRIAKTDDGYTCEFDNKSNIDIVVITREFENYMIDYINSEKVYVDN